MHQILRGAFGAALVYPLVWYYYAHSGPVQSGAAAVPQALVQAQPSKQVAPPQQSVEAAPQQWAAPPPPAAKVAAAGPEPAPEPPEVRAVRQRVAEVAPQLAQPSEPQLPRAPRVNEPKVPFPALAELQEAFGQMKDLQAVAHNPQALDERVQTTEYDAEKVARLKALAEQFVELPTPASERYMPAGRTSRSAPSR